jgi:3',5'-cyclic AMP phosphodiesterase CpdA
MGLARWRTAQSRIAASGADLVLCGHDHQEGAGVLEGVVISTAGTHTPRTRGGRPSAFNVVRADQHTIAVQHHRWHRASGRFVPGEPTVFPRPRRTAKASGAPPVHGNPASVR